MGIGIKMWTYSGHATRSSQSSVRIAFGLHNLVEKWKGTLLKNENLSMLRQVI